MNKPGAGRRAAVEWFPVVDDAGRTVGRATRRQCHSGTMLLHPVVHLHIFNSAGELYLQKRAPGKDTHPGKWDTAVGGHLDAGETVDRALRREAKEELGLTEFVPVFIGRYIFESPVEREMVYSFRTLFDGELYPDPDELSGGRFWRMPEIRAHLHSGVFTPNFVDEYCRFTALC